MRAYTLGGGVSGAKDNVAGRSTTALLLPLCVGCTARVRLLPSPGANVEQGAKAWQQTGTEPPGDRGAWSSVPASGIA